MLALTIRQPWAHAILHLGKPIENRNWSTRVRGRVGLHAAKGMTLDEYEDAKAFIADIDPSLSLPDFDRLDRAALIGSVDVADCVKDHSSPWFQGPYGFILRNPIALREPVPCKGALNFWDIPEDVMARCTEVGSVLDEIVYAYADGREVFREPMIFKRLWGLEIVLSTTRRRIS